MKLLLLCCAFALTAPLLANDASDRAANPAINARRQSLHTARMRYQDAVRAHGPHSKEANDARAQVRESRRAFHAERRAVKPL